MPKAILNSKLPKNTLRENGVGFTLLELLIVMAIIGTLSSIGIISYNHYKEKAKYTVLVLNLDNLYAPIILCLENGEELTCFKGDPCVNPIDEFDTPEGEPLCPSDLVNVWPEVSQTGYYYQNITSNPNDKTFRIELKKTDGQGDHFITCTESETCEYMYGPR